MNAEYISLKSQKVIAHRGLSSIFPQNTIQALISALFCSDLVEIDVHLTKDKNIIIFHDRGLKRITNIQQYEQFKNRLKQLTIDYYHKPASDCWLRDFTLQQLKQLKVYQKDKKRPQLLDYDFQIATLQQLLIQFVKIKNTHNLKCGILIQLKEQIADEITQNDKILCKKVCELLTKYQLDRYESQVILQSFCIPILDFIITENRIVQLYDKHIQISQNFLCSNKQKNVVGIGITQENLLKMEVREDKSYRSVKQICDSLNYQIFYWTLKDDDLQNIPFAVADYSAAYLRLKQQGVTGFITQFPHLCQKYIKNNTITLEQILQRSGLLSFKQAIKL